MVKHRVLAFVIATLVPVVIGIVLAVRDQQRVANSYVVSRDARVAAHAVAAQSSVAGRLGQHLIHVGETVQEGEVIAWVSGPAGLHVNVRAPQNGTVLSQPVDEGGIVGAGQTVATIGNLDTLWVAANVDEGRTRLVRVGQPARVRIEAVGVTLDGTVASIAPVTQDALADAQAAGGGPAPAGGAQRAPHTVPVRIALDDSATHGAVLAGLIPGMQAEVHIDVR